jgi:hypothetical protein
VDRAQKEEKMEQALNKLRETWSRVEFQFIQFKDTQVGDSEACWLQHGLPEVASLICDSATAERVQRGSAKHLGWLSPAYQGVLYTFMMGPAW